MSNPSTASSPPQPTTPTPPRLTPSPADPDPAHPLPSAVTERQNFRTFTTLWAPIQHSAFDTTADVERCWAALREFRRGFVTEVGGAGEDVTGREEMLDWFEREVCMR
jgi:hypothetical protein